MNSSLSEYISMEHDIVSMLVSRILLSQNKIPCLEKEAAEYTGLGMKVSLQVVPSKDFLFTYLLY